MVGPPDSLHVRMARSALGDALLYEELRQDPGAIRQAVFVVVLVSIVHGIAASLGTLYAEGDLTASNVFISSFIFTGLGWTLSALFSYMIVSVIAGTSAAGFLGGTFPAVHSERGLHGDARPADDSRPRAGDRRRGGTRRDFLDCDGHDDCNTRVAFVQHASCRGGGDHWDDCRSGHHRTDGRSRLWACNVGRRRASARLQ